MNKCSYCESFDTKRTGCQWLCLIHRRFRQMIGKARVDKKVVPSRKQLDCMLAKLEAMKCPHCQREMQWSRDDKATTQVTLQHYRSGELGLICLACNTRHQHFDGDEFFDVPKDKKRCSVCKIIKETSEFGHHTRYWNGLRSECKPCGAAKKREYDAKKRIQKNQLLQPKRTL